MPFNDAGLPSDPRPHEYEPAYRGFGETRSWTDKDGHGWQIQFSIKKVGERLSLTDLSISPSQDGYALTQSVLRQLPIAEWEREMFVEEAAHLATLSQRSESAPHSGRRYSNDELRQVAKIYLTALNARLPVQKTVASALGLSLSTATKRIVAARRYGYLPPVQKDRAKDV